MTSVEFTIAVVVASILAATTVALLLLHVLGVGMQVLRRRSSNPKDSIEAEYQAARRAMNQAAGQSWRNIID